MKIRNVLFTLLLMCVFLVQDGLSQVTDVKYQIRYNATTCRWDCYLIIQSGTATTAQQRLQFNAQYSVVVPTGSGVSVAQNYMPLQNNQTYTGTIPLKWQLSSSVFAPAAEPQSDFYSITPTLSPSSFYNNLSPGDTIRLFALSITPLTNCGSGVRIFVNGVDPGSSAPGMGGGDFSNGFTLGSANQIYTSNLPKVLPPKPVLSATTTCSIGVEIDLTATTSACQTPLTYSWAGPQSYSATTQDVAINPATILNAGLYTVTVSDARGCSSTLSITAVAKPVAGADQTACASGSVTLTGSGPSTGTWSALGTNPSGSVLGSTAGGMATANYTTTASGIFKYQYNTGACSDTTDINVILQNAGPDPASVGCFSSGTVSMSAVGTGTWTVSNLSAGTAVIANPTSPTTTISGFSAPGTYILEWTLGACKDVAEIIVGNNCTCVIVNNSITSVTPSSYCGSSGSLLLDGGTVTPSGGTYTWQYSLNGGAFAAATGTNNQEDYSTINLGDGTHRFRRLFFLAGTPPCFDTSNVVLFTVNPVPSIPTNLTGAPNPVCLGNTVNLQVTNNPGATYSWTADLPGSGLVTSATNTTTMTPTSAGVYLINVTQTVGSCVSPSASLSVIANSVPSTPTAGSVTGVNPVTCGGSNGSIAFSGLSPNASFTLNYTKNGTSLFASLTSNGSGVITLPNQSAGTYANFSISNATGCSSGIYAGPITLTDPNAPNAPANLTADPNPTCANTVVNLSVTNTVGATYTWTASSTAAGLSNSTINTTTLLPTASGFYTINVTQTIAGCVSPPSSVGISINDTPPTPTALTVSGANPSSCGVTNGTISFSGLSSLTAYTITYSKNGTPTSASVTTGMTGIAVVNGLSSGAYTNFRIENFSGCKSGLYPGPINLTDPSTPSAPTGLTATPNPVCVGSSVALSLTNTAGATYNWSAAPTGSGLVSSTTSSTTMVPTVSGTFTINVTQTIAGCTSLPAIVTVTANPTPPTPTAGTVSRTNPTICGGSNGSITITGLLSNTTYTIQYSKNTVPATATLTSSASGSISISGLTAGTYTNFKVVNSSNCGSGTYAGPVALTDPNAPLAPAGITATPNPVCPGVTVNLSVTNNVGATYAWTASSTAAGLVVSTTNAATMVSNTAGNYTISVTQTVAGCTSPASTIAVTVNGSPPTPTAGSISSTNPSVCGGADGTISLSGLLPNTIYLINYTKNGNALSSSLTTNATGVITIGSLSAGNYTGFKVTNTGGCASGVFNGITSLSDPGSPPAPANLVANPNPACIGTLVSLSVTNNPGATYIWSASSTNAGLVTSSTNTTTMLATAVGQYTITVIQNIAGCTSPAANVIVNINPIPPTLAGANMSGNNPTTCGGSNGAIALSGLPANSTYTLNYSKNSNTTTASITTDVNGSATVNGLTAGNYTNFSLTGAGGCSSGVFAGPIALTDPSIPPAPAGLNAVPNPVCLGTLTNLSVINNAGAIYNWSASSTSAGIGNSTSNTNTMNAINFGSYTISVTQTVAGCTSPPSSLGVTINPLPPTPTVATISKVDPSTCLGTDGSISLSGYIQNETFTVEYTKNGSPISATFNSNGTGTITLPNLSAGTYSNFRITNSQGCSSGLYTGNVILMDPPAQGIPLNLTANPNPSCLGTSISLSVANELGATYNWSASSTAAGLVGNSTNQVSMLATIASDFTVSVTKTVAGCTSSAATINVTVNPVPVTLSANSFTTINPTCGGNNGVINISGLIPSTTYTIGYSKNGVPTSEILTSSGSGVAMLLGLSAGSFTNFRLTNSVGCSSGIYNGPVDLTDPGLPSPPSNLQSSPDQVCIRSTVALSVDNNPNATYDWSISNIGGGLIQSSTNIAMMMPTRSGVYTVSVTQTTLGCTSLPSTIQIDVKGDCYNPDFDVTYVNIPLTGNVSTNDVSLPDKTYGPVSVVSGNPSLCVPNVASDGTYTFNCSVAGKYNFVVPVCTGNPSMMCSNMPLLITVLEQLVANNPPIVNHDYVRTKMGMSIMVNVRANDKCQNAQNCSLDNPTIVVSPINGSYNASTMIYTPNPGFIGFDSLRYRVCQNPVVTPINCQEAWVYITVIGDTAPNVTNAMDDYGQTPLNTPLVVSAAYGLRANDTDPEGNQQIITPMNVTFPNRGTFLVENDGSYTFTPFTGYIGPVDCPYEVCDNLALKACDIATLHILVEPSVPKSKVGNRVWHDTNADGIQNAGEQGIPGVIVKLYSSANILIGTKTTNAVGEYSFDNLTAGTYYLKFEAPISYEFTFANRGNDDEKDSDVPVSKNLGTTGLIVLAPGETNLSVDAGLYKCSKIGDRVWYDLNKNDIWNTNENGINGIQVNLWRNHFGYWLVWSSMYTKPKPNSGSDDGWYEFCAPPGEYYVEVVMPPLGLVQALPNVGNNRLIDSDLTNRNGVGTTDKFTVSSGISKLDLGAGFYPMAVAGNLVWLDANQNGVQEGTEPKMAGIKVQAYDANTHEILTESMTDNEGIYKLDYLQKKDVYLKFAIPAQYSATRPGATTDDLDSDVTHTFGPNTTSMYRMSPGVENQNIDLGVAFGVLPVDWLYINAIRKNKVHQIYWATQQEVNVSYYQLERKLAKTGEFLPIGEKVAALKSQGKVLNYEQFDFDTEISGLYYYRVKQVDIDGKYSYSDIVYISVTNDLNIAIYPSPTVSQSNLEIYLEVSSMVNIELYDGNGRYISTINKSILNEGEHKFKIDAMPLIPGVYNVVVDINGEKINKKLIKIE